MNTRMIRDPVEKSDLAALPRRRIRRGLPGPRLIAYRIARGQRLVANLSIALPALSLAAVVTAQPVIDQQPTDQVVAIGGVARFSVAATGAAPVTYQWWRDGVDIQGATGSVLEIANVQPQDEANYSVQVADADGAIPSDPAALTVDPEWVLYNPSNSGLPYKGVVDMEIDREGNLWFTTGRWYADEGGGVAKFDGREWTVYSTANSVLPSNDCTGVTLDGSGCIWVSTEGGLVRCDERNGWEVLSRDQMWFPAFDLAGKLWLGSGNGLVCYDGTNWTRYQTGSSPLPNNTVWWIVPDRDDRKWIGTYGGLAVFDNQDWSVYTPVNSDLPSSNVYALAIEAGEIAWMGAYGRGMARFDGQDWTIYNRGNSGIPSVKLDWILVDSNGVKWMGTEGAGVGRFDGTNWQTYNHANSQLPDNYVYSLLMDPYENLWIGMRDGGVAVFRAGGVILPLRIESLLPDGEGSALLQWTGGRGPYQVQSRASLGAGEWENHGAATEEQSVTIDTGPASRLFRVVQAGL